TGGGLIRLLPTLPHRGGRGPLVPLTGRPPFVGDSPVAVAYQHVREEPPAATTLIPEISPALESVRTKSLA
ncbi:MAG: hypothetical protein L0L05_02465, partial [Yaniella sp.]|nr:hypothetical protein [Yaniella sp.]